MSNCHKSSVACVLYEGHDGPCQSYPPSVTIPLLPDCGGWFPTPDPRDAELARLRELSQLRETQLSQLRSDVERLTRERDEEKRLKEMNAAEIVEALDAMRTAERERDQAAKVFYALWNVSGDALKAAKNPERNPFLGEEPWKAHVRRMAEIEASALDLANAQARQAEARVAALEGAARDASAKVRAYFAHSGKIILTTETRSAFEANHDAGVAMNRLDALLSPPAAPEKPKVCVTCKGSGRIPAPLSPGASRMAARAGLPADGYEQPCPACAGGV